MNIVEKLIKEALGIKNINDITAFVTALKTKPKFKNLDFNYPTSIGGGYKNFSDKNQIIKDLKAIEKKYPDTQFEIWHVLTGTNNSDAVRKQQEIRKSFNKKIQELDKTINTIKQKAFKGWPTMSYDFESLPKDEKSKYDKALAEREKTYESLANIDASIQDDERDSQTTQMQVQIKLKGTKIGMVYDLTKLQKILLQLSDEEAALVKQINVSWRNKDSNVFAKNMSKGTHGSLD